MRKAISVLLSFCFVCLLFPLKSYGENEMSIAEFSQQISSLIQAYSFSEANSSGDDTGKTYRLIVKTNSNQSLQNDYGALAKIEGYGNLHVLQFLTSSAVESAKTHLQNISDVEYVEEDYYLSVPNTVRDVQSINLKDYLHLSWGSSKVDANVGISAVNSLPCPPQIVVAVLDSGLASSHPFFKNRYIDSHVNMIDGSDSTEDGFHHGTHVSGIIVDNTPSNVLISPYKVLNDEEGKGSYLGICTAIEMATNNNVDVINLSLGAKYIYQTTYNRYNEVIRQAVNHGICVVSSAGNDADDTTYYLPAAIPDVITVSASTISNRSASFSNYGDCVDIAAPGEGILSTFPNGQYAFDSGTSMAAPFVSAASAILKSLIPGILPCQVKERMLLNAIVPSHWDTKYGAGIVNFKTMLSDKLTPSPTITLTETSAVITADPAATIYYTTDGSEPTVDSAVYTGPINTSNVRIIKAIACKLGYLPSAVSSYRLKWDEDITVRYKGTKKIDFPTGYSVKRIYSGDDEIATLSADGKVTGNKVGDTTVYVEFQKNCRVTYHIHVEYAWWQQLIRWFLFGFLWY